MIKIEITSETTAEMFDEFRRLLQGEPRVDRAQVAPLAAPPAAPVAPEPADPEPEGAPENPEAEEKPKAKKSGRKSKAQMEAETAEGPAEVADKVTPYTIDDLRKVCMAYAQKYGMPAAQDDGKPLFEKYGVGNISSCASLDETQMDNIVSEWLHMAENNPNNREVVG